MKFESKQRFTNFSCERKQHFYLFGSSYARTSIQIGLKFLSFLKKMNESNEKSCHANCYYFSTFIISLSKSPFFSAYARAALETIALKLLLPLLLCFEGKVLLSLSFMSQLRNYSPTFQTYLSLYIKAGRALKEGLIYDS